MEILNKGVKTSDFVAGDIVLWNGEKKVVVDGERYSTDVYPTEGYTPIGVVVIPASHLEDGKARMMATRWMSCDDPENGSIEPETMVWGTATDISCLTSFTEVPVIARYDGKDQGGVTALTEPQTVYTQNCYAFLPSDNMSWTGEINPEDEGTRWCQSNTYWTTSSAVSANNFYAPSPYASDGTPNPLYRATYYSGGTINNALSYFDGKHQTDAILEARGTKDYGTWKPGSETPTDFPAASCCDMYHTVGTSQGDWYLPSQAELGYVIARINRISTVMANVNGMQELPSCWAWSSTEVEASTARPVYFHNGLVYTWLLKDSNLLSVVAFSVV